MQESSFGLDGFRGRIKNNGSPAATLALALLDEVEDGSLKPDDLPYSILPSESVDELAQLIVDAYREDGVSLRQIAHYIGGASDIRDSVNWLHLEFLADSL